MATLEQDHFRASTQYQERYQSTVGDKVGFNVPAPTLGESVNTYRCKVLRDLKHQFLPKNNQYYKINYLRDLRNDSTTLNIIEPQILAEVLAQAQNPANVPPGEMRKVIEVNPDNGMKMVKWIGQTSFVVGMGQPPRRVISFRTPQGAVDASGRFLR
jgi:hypothetical protein